MDAYRESAKRTKNFSPDDWARIKEETETVEARLAQDLAAFLQVAIEANARRAEGAA